MEDSVIKSAKILDNGTQDKNDNVEIFRNEQADPSPNENIESCISAATTDNKLAVLNESVNKNTEEIVGDSKDPADSLSSVIIKTETKMTKPLRSRVSSCKKETAKSNQEKNKTGKSMPRKVLAEKQIPIIRKSNRPAVLLRSSSRKRALNLTGKNNSSSSNALQISSDDGIAGRMESIDKENCSSSANKENIVAEDVVCKTEEIVPFENLTLMEKIIIREKEKLENIMCAAAEVQSTPIHNQTNVDGALNNEGRIKGLADGSTDSVKNEDNLPKKTYHRRKCSAPFRNERVQTRQSCSITLMQNKNEYKYFPHDPKTVECMPFEPDEELEQKIPVEECAIICTPDITVKTTYSQSSNKRELENSADENPKQKLRHLNAQAMPVYMSRITVAKNEIESPPTSHMEHDEADEKEDNPVVTEEAQQHLNNTSVCSRIDKATDPKYSYFSNTDSEETLSNVESVPNSPPQEGRPKVAGKNLKLSNKCLKLNSGQSCSRRKDRNLVMPGTPAAASLDGIDKTHNVGVKFASKHKLSQTEISSTSNCNAKRHQSELRYYVDTSANQNPSSITDTTETDHLLKLEETRPWLRHYERGAHGTHAETAENSSEFGDNTQENSVQQNHSSHQQKIGVERTDNKKTDNSVSDNLHGAEVSARRNRSGKLRDPVTKPSFKKRGRPRKENTKTSKTNSQESKRNAKESGAAPNGSGLTKLELERLFFKFLQHGHFRVDPGQTAIIIPNNDLYQNFSERMQTCYDPKKYYTHPHNVQETQSNSESKTYPYSQQYQLPTDIDGNRFYPSNNFSSSEHAGHGVRTINSNSIDNFPNELAGQTTYSRNLSPSMHTNIHNSYTDSENTNGYNAIAALNLNYQQNFYSNNVNVMGNNSYTNSFSSIMNSNNSMNEMNSGTAAASLLSTTNNFDNDFNHILNTQHQNSCREMDLTTNNGNTVSVNSINSMQNSPTNNVNPDWNLSSVNQHLDSVNGIIMDLNSFNNANESSQAINRSPDLNTAINNQNTEISGPNPWMNSRFSVLPPWHTSLPMYNSYLNNNNLHYKNMYNPYAGFTAFDFPNYPYSNINPRSGMGVNNANPWMQNIFPGSDVSNPTFNATNTEFSDMNSGSLLENTSNQGMNLSLSSDTVHAQTNAVELNNIDLDNEFKSNIELSKKDAFAQVETGSNNELQQSTRSYGDQICFIPQIQDHYTNQRSDNLEGIANPTYRRTGPPNCEIVAELGNNRETEMSKLRQELADFTRQYSEDQTSPTSQTPQGDDVFV